jgi:HSP20 family protein
MTVMATRPSVPTAIMEGAMAGNIQKHSPETAVPPAAPTQHPLLSLRDEVDRLFDSFFPTVAGRRGLFDMDPFRRLGGWVRSGGELAPEVDVKETDERFEITAELPGMDEKDVEVTLREGMLTISGEKKMETKEDKANYHLTERSYGRFVRTFRLPDTADEDGISAGFTKGVLSVIVPKTAAARAHEKKIEVKPH